MTMVKNSSHNGSAELTCCTCGLADPTCQFLQVVTALSCSHLLKAPAKKKNIAAFLAVKGNGRKGILTRDVIKLGKYLFTW